MQGLTDLSEMLGVSIPQAAKLGQLIYKRTSVNFYNEQVAGLPQHHVPLATLQNRLTELAKGNCHAGMRRGSIGDPRKTIVRL